MYKNVHRGVATDRALKEKNSISGMESYLTDFFCAYKSYYNDAHDEKETNLSLPRLVELETLCNGLQLFVRKLIECVVAVMYVSYHDRCDTPPPKVKYI